MKDEAEVMKKIKKIVSEGPEKLQIVSDFDFTLTKQHDNGTPVPSSVVMFLSCKQIPARCVKKDNDLRLKYKAIEIDPNISLEEKIDAMNEWYLETHENLRSIEFDRGEINKVAEVYCHTLRDGTKELFSKLKKFNIPILVFSAGIGDVLESILKCQGILSENVKIISNFMKFDGDTLNGFENSNRLIHPFNKNSHTVENDYFKILHERTNVILMGDSLGDASMADVGVDNCVLRIGFFYNAKESLSQFMEAFDIVLVDDQTMNVALEIVDSIV
ncbi:7-methylguanosine phosphate-specific 5'-nucleotidase isoform X2 [Nasonia vitripennis]|nr:7-methylguanosine phosphate-specific 5'-nucleotidase isoform X2 [Nasonia vitripennis]XP_031782593.1 7-methylguanosine phosphate-specific 5'-nucleotidase isoform X2 [Nasonia vitripennis]